MPLSAKFELLQWPNPKYAGRRKSKENVESGYEEKQLTKYERSLKKLGTRDVLGLGPVEAPQVWVLKPSGFRYFHRGQAEKPYERDYVVMRLKKVKLGENDKLSKKFRHKEVLISLLGGSQNLENAVAVMEELVSRKKLIKCVLNLDLEELGLLLMFLQKQSTVPRYSRLLMGLTQMVVERRLKKLEILRS